MILLLPYKRGMGSSIRHGGLCHPVPKILTLSRFQNRSIWGAPCLEINLPCVYCELSLNFVLLPTLCCHLLQVGYICAFPLTVAVWRCLLEVCGTIPTTKWKRGCYFPPRQEDCSTIRKTSVCQPATEKEETFMLLFQIPSWITGRCTLFSVYLLAALFSSLNHVSWPKLTSGTRVFFVMLAIPLYRHILIPTKLYEIATVISFFSGFPWCLFYLYPLHSLQLPIVRNNCSIISTFGADWK